MLTAFETNLIDRFQHGMPIASQPYAVMAEVLGCSEVEVIQALERLADSGVLSRVGPVFEHRRAGASTLAAMKVPQTCLARVADQVSALSEVNHNYLREHEWNLWFVLTAPDQTHLDAVLAKLRAETGLPVMSLPMEQAYCIDLGFPVGALSRMPS